MITALYFGLLIGLLLFNLITHLQITAGTGWPRREVALLAGILAILAYDVSTYAEYRVNDVGAYFGLIRVQILSGIIFFASLLEFVATVAGRKPGKAVRAFEAAFGAFAILRLFLPYSGFYSSVRGMRSLELPWGDRINLIEGSSTLLFALYMLFVLVFIGIAAYYLLSLRRTKRRGQSASLLAALAVLVAGMLLDFAIAAGLVRWLYMTETAYVAFLIVASIEVSKEVVASAELRKTLEKSLEDKEALVREINHRVKNNLSVLVGLLSLQAHDETDERARSRLLLTINRIYSIAQVHEMAYGRGDCSTIDLSDFLDEIARAAIQSFEASGVDIEVRSSAGGARAKMAVPVDIAVPLGLIANEIFVNSIRFAFPRGEGGKLYHQESLLRDRGEARLSLLLGDDGRGFPSSKGEIHGGLGSQLIAALASQIDARVSLESEGGTRYRIELAAPASCKD
jgi:two-component sensor histidine kinase